MFSQRNAVRWANYVSSCYKFPVVFMSAKKL